MKKLSIVILAIALLLPAGMAQAFAIYNHVDREVCVSTAWTRFTFRSCKFKISAHGTHNGGHGDSLSNVNVNWRVGHGKCRCSDYDFNIPDGGYARIYNHEVKIYRHNGAHIDTKNVSEDHA